MYIHYELVASKLFVCSRIDTLCCLLNCIFCTINVAVIAFFRFYHTLHLFPLGRRLMRIQLVDTVGARVLKIFSVKITLEDLFDFLVADFGQTVLMMLRSMLTDLSASRILSFPSRTTIC